MTKKSGFNVIVITKVYKGFFCRILGIIRRKYLAPNAHLSIVGDVPLLKLKTREIRRQSIVLGLVAPFGWLCKLKLLLEILAGGLRFPLDVSSSFGIATNNGL